MSECAGRQPDWLLSLLSAPSALPNPCSSPDCMESLRCLHSPRPSHPTPCSKCPKVGPKTAEKAKLAWEASHGNAALAAVGKSARTSAAAALSSSAGLTVPQLLEAPPTLGFLWGPAVRCYSPHLHAAEQVVAQRSLQRAAAYRQASARQLSRVRKWVDANQSGTGAWGVGVGGWGACCAGDLGWAHLCVCTFSCFDLLLRPLLLVHMPACLSAPPRLLFPPHRHPTASTAALCRHPTQ